MVLTVLVGIEDCLLKTLLGPGLRITGLMSAIAQGHVGKCRDGITSPFPPIESVFVLLLVLRLFRHVVGRVVGSDDGVALHHTVLSLSGCSREKVIFHILFKIGQFEALGRHFRTQSEDILSLGVK